MNHYRGHRGYALLTTFLSLGLVLLAGKAIVLLGVINTPGMETLSPVIMIGALFLAPFLVVGRFMRIETRKPTLYDTNTIAMQTVAILATLTISLYLIATLGSWAATREFPATLSKKALATTGAGVLGFIILCYIMIFLNFLLLTYLRKQPAGVSPTEFH